jgi:hypothetical protein
MSNDVILPIRAASEKQLQILRLTTPELCPKEQKSLFGDPLKKTFGAPFAQDDSFYAIR